MYEMSAGPKSGINDKVRKNIVQIKPTRENDSYGNRTGRRDKVVPRKLDSFGSLELVSEIIYLSMESDRDEKDWMKEVEIEYQRENSDDISDPLGESVDWAGPSRNEYGNRKLEHFVTESLTMVADKTTFRVESDKIDEEWMDEVEIDYTREEDSGVAVDPLGDSEHTVFAEQQNVRYSALDYSVDGSEDDTKYITVNGSCFDGNNKLKPRDSTALFIDIYAPKSKESYVRETQSHCSSAKQWRYACRLCYYRTNNRHDLHKHCRAHHGEKSFDSALKHIGHPSRGKSGTCSVCGQRFSQMGVLMLHMKTHMRDQFNVRNRCRKIISSRKRKKTPTSVRAEPNNTAEDDDLKPKDAIDDITVGVDDPLSYKERQAEEGSTALIEKPYPCKSCEYRSSRKQDLKMHELNHTAEKPHKCFKCSYRCKRAGYLKMHMKIHLEPKICTDAAIQQRNGHGRVHHCPICHYWTRQMGNLRVHMRTHTGEKPFDCSVCHERFTQNASLKVHMRNHTGEKPYLCKVCSKGFTQISGRNSHEKTCPYPPRTKMCDICNYRCKRTHDLLNHEKIHRSIRVVRLQKTK